jgi:BirA family biotin operon repressor/biotin-[acetyl-CoA-carboxylase] ligase
MQKLFPEILSFKTLNICNPFDAPVYHADCVSSTMDISRCLAQENKAHGTVITADFQETGRGRTSNRKWQTQKTANLLFTVLLRYKNINEIPPALTLRTGLAVSLAIEDFVSLKQNVMIKWPNDIMINSKKTAGILCESDGRNVHVGIGVNVSQKEFSEELQEKATSIALALGSDIDFSQRFILLEKILACFCNELNRKDGWKTCIEKKLYKRGESVIFADGAADSCEEVKGVLKGIGSEGELLIIPQGENEARSFITGELKFLYNF